MRFLFAILTTLTLAACESPQTASAPAGALTELSESIAAGINANADRSTNGGVTFLEARANGNSLTITSQASPSLDRLIVDVPRGQLQNFIRMRQRQELCASEGFRAYLAAGGTVNLRLVNAVGVERIRVPISNC